MDYEADIVSDSNNSKIVKVEGVRPAKPRGREIEKADAIVTRLMSKHKEFKDEHLLVRAAGIQSIRVAAMVAERLEKKLDDDEIPPAALPFTLSVTARAGKELLSRPAPVEQPVWSKVAGLSDESPESMQSAIAADQEKITTKTRAPVIDSGNIEG